ncbi:universal stress protein [Skermania sp. ID1734]|uniref:universal stress protein n=1 Tax=Skermania sp. ID1734 TaxID=2597516 RepID=UPI00117F5BC4|nr:universal stress protein [Skermania sp. ID1734]TSD99751.1 universal stress protein [Skermania sp. ID1734]
MGSYPRILLGTDGSTDAQAATQVAGQIAVGLGVPVEVICVREDDKDKDWAAGILDTAEAQLRTLGVAEINPKQSGGDPPDVLIAAANDNPDSLLVVGSSGLHRASSRLVGSTSNRLSHHSLADVLYARDPAPKHWNFVALATDGTETSYRAVTRGLNIARALDARARLITAARSQDDGDKVLDEAFAALGLGADVDREVLVDPQAGSALILAGWKYEMMVIGNKSMSGPSRLLGSIANKVTHGLETNLLLVNTTRG